MAGRLVLPDMSWDAVDRAQPRTSHAEVRELLEAYRRRTSAARRARQLRQAPRSDRRRRTAQIALRRARREVTRAEVRVADGPEVRRAQRRHRIDTREKGLEL